MKAQIFNKITCSVYNRGRYEATPNITMYRGGKFELNLNLSELIDCNYIAFTTTTDSRLFIIKASDIKTILGLPEKQKNEDSEIVKREPE